MWALLMGLALAAAEPEPYPGVADPMAFMRARYAEYETGREVRTLATDSYASERLRGHLYAYDEAAGGQELDSLDVWTDSVDWRIGRVTLTPFRSRHPAWRTILASFDNRGRPVRLLFRWVHEGGAWRLDEIVRLGRPGWTFTQRLAIRPSAPPNP